jgi:hypothetical protein
MKKLGGFGFVLALAALVILLLLAGKAWKAVMPAASQVLRPGGTTIAVPDHGEKETGDAVRSGGLPNMKEMGQSTDAHIQRVKEAAKGQD